MLKRDALHVASEDAHATRLTVGAARLNELSCDQAERVNFVSRLNRRTSRRVREKKRFASFSVYLHVCFLTSRVPFAIAAF